MKSGEEISVAHLETIRRRRMRRNRHQRAIKVGIPVEVSLKPMALNSSQQKETSNRHVRPHVDRKHGIMTPKRVSIMVAVGFHLIAVLLAAYSIVWPTRLEAETKIVEIVHLEPEHPRRVRRPIYDLGRDTTPRDGRLTPNASPRGSDDRVLGIAPILPGDFAPFVRPHLETTRVPIFSMWIEPEYPNEAKRAWKGGTVVLKATIDVDGNAKDIVIKEDKVGFGCARAAIAALKASRFYPAKRGGESVLQRITVPYTFNVEDSLNPWEGGICTPEPTYNVDFNTFEFTIPPKWLQKILPEYPNEAKRAGKEGRVVLIATVGPDGKAKDIRIKEDKVGFGCAEAAIEALRASLLTPAKRWDGKSVPLRIAVPYDFKLEDSSDPPEQAGCSIPSPDPIHRDGSSSLEITRPPAFRTKIEPKHPRAARIAQKEGKVVLEATIDVDGKAKDIKIKEDKVGFGCAEAAIEALKASRFIPAKRGVESVPIRIAIPYQFKLED